MLKGKKKRFFMGSAILFILFIIVLLVTVGSGKDIANSEELIKELKTHRYKIEIEETSGDRPALFSVEPKIIKVNDKILEVYEFKSKEEADEQGKNISKDGRSIKNIKGRMKDGATLRSCYVNWSEPPHFYKRGNIIVVYSGKNLRLQYNLAKIMGKQVAGDKWYLLIK